MCQVTEDILLSLVPLIIIAMDAWELLPVLIIYISRQLQVVRGYSLRCPGIRETCLLNDDENPHETARVHLAGKHGRVDMACNGGTGRYSPLKSLLWVHGQNV